MTLKGCPHQRDLCFPGGAGKEGVGKVLAFFLLPQLLNFARLDAVGIGLGLEARMIPKQETVTVFLTSMSQFLRA